MIHRQAVSYGTKSGHFEKGADLRGKPQMNQFALME